MRIRYLTIIIVVIILSTVNTSSVATPTAEALFLCHLLAPTNNPVRMQYAQIIEGNFPKIGVDVELDLITWSVFNTRVFNEEVGPYNEGGYDMCFFGLSLGAPTSHPGALMTIVYAADAIPPLGYNAMYWAPDPDDTKGWMDYRAAEQDTIIKDVNKELNLTKATEMLKDWSKIYYDTMPNVMIYSEVEVHTLSTGLYGYDPVAQPFTLEDMWMAPDYTGTPGTVVLASSAAGSGWLPQINSDVFSGYWIPNVFEGLLGLSASLDTVLPAGIDRAAWMQDRYGTTEYLACYPRVGTYLGRYSADDQGNEGLNWSIHVRDDAYWHDGHQLDAWDVVFSYQTFLIPAIGSNEYNGLTFAFGHDDDPSNFTGKAKAHGNYSFYARDVDNNGFYETVDFLFNVTFAPWMTDHTSHALLPEHILGDPNTHGFVGFTDTMYKASNYNLSGWTFDPSLWNVKPTAWTGHSYNTGIPTDPGGYAGPIGTGPYYFESYDQTTGKGTVKKWVGKKWNGSAWVTASGAGSGYRNQAAIADAPDTGIIVITSLSGGLSDMKAGDVNILDHQFTMGTILDELQADPAILPTLTAAPGWQAFCFNPKFIVKTPLSDFDRPFNRRGFRHAVSHIIPREDIINILLAGLGTEIFSPIPITSWAAIPPDDFLLWKRTYEAPGGHKLEWDATTPFDDYNITRALEYMSSEGYDMRPFGGPGPNVVWPGSEPTTSIIPTTSIPTAHTTIPSTTTSSVLPTTSETTTTQISTTSTLSIPTITPSLEALILILAITLMIAFFRRRK